MKTQAWWTWGGPARIGAAIAMMLPGLLAHAEAMTADTTGAIVEPAAPGETGGARPLAPGDLVFVNVFRHPDLSTSVALDGNGNISLPYVGNVMLGGLSEAEAGARVTTALSAILKSPRVRVSRSGPAPVFGGGTRTESMTTQVVPLQNANAETIFTALTGMTSAGGSVSFDPDTNSLILTDTADALQNMMSVVRQLDQMQTQMTQVHIEARVAEVESSAAKELGVRWWAQGDHAVGGYYPNARQDARVNALRGINDPMYNERIDEDVRNNQSFSSRRFVDQSNFDRRLQVPVQIPAPGQLFLGYFNAGIDVGAFLDALAADNKAELLASPYIRTVNHKTATIRMVEEFPYQELGTAGFSTTQTTRFIDIGISMDVTPHVRRDPDGLPYVQLDLQPEVSTATGVANGVPIRSVRTSESVANVRNGQTLVIGGIATSDNRNVDQRVPGLGKVPVFGRLFKHKESSRAERELMIFVTPTIYERPEDISWDRALPLSEKVAGADLGAVRAPHPDEARKE